MSLASPAFQVRPRATEDVSPPAARRRSHFSPPVERALATLRGRAGAEGRSGFSLDGRPAPLRAIIREANRVRAALGDRPIAYPGEVEARGVGR